LRGIADAPTDRGSLNPRQGRVSSSGSLAIFAAMRRAEAAASLAAFNIL